MPGTVDRALLYPIATLVGRTAVRTYPCQAVPLHL